MHQYELSDATRRDMEEDLDALARQVENFPVADLHVLVEGNARSNDVSAKLTLILPGSTLVTNDHDVVLTTAFERCLKSLLHEVEGYKSRLDNEAERQKVEKGTLHKVLPTTDIDLAAVESAVADGDYARFRNAMLPYEEAVDGRAGRWVQRFPKYEARIGKDIKMSDVVEEIFLTAFDEYPRRPSGIPLGEWLDELIDRSVKELMTRTDQELENINLNRTALAATNSPPSPLRRGGPGG